MWLRLTFMSLRPFPVPPSDNHPWGAPGEDRQSTEHIQNGDNQQRQVIRQQQEHTQVNDEADCTEAEAYRINTNNKRQTEKKGPPLGIDQPRKGLRSSGRIEEISLGYKNRREVTVRKEEEVHTPHTSRPDEKGELAGVGTIPLGATPYPGLSLVAWSPIHSENDRTSSGPPLREEEERRPLVENGRQQGAHGATVGAVDNSLEVGGETETNTENKEIENREIGLIANKKLGGKGETEPDTETQKEIETEEETTINNDKIKQIEGEEEIEEEEESNEENTIIEDREEIVGIEEYKEEEEGSIRQEEQSEEDKGEETSDIEEQKLEEENEEEEIEEKKEGSTYDNRGTPGAKETREKKGEYTKGEQIKATDSGTPLSCNPSTGRELEVVARRLFTEQKLLDTYKNRRQREINEEIGTIDINKTPKSREGENIGGERKSNLTPIQRELQSTEFQEYNIAQEEEESEVTEIRSKEETSKETINEETDEEIQTRLTPIQRRLQWAHIQEHETRRRQKEKEIKETGEEEEITGRIEIEKGSEEIIGPQDKEPEKETGEREGDSTEIQNKEAEEEITEKGNQNIEQEGEEEHTEEQEIERDRIWGKEYEETLERIKRQQEEERRTKEAKEQQDRYKAEAKRKWEENRSGEIKETSRRKERAKSRRKSEGELISSSEEGEWEKEERNNRSKSNDSRLRLNEQGLFEDTQPGIGIGYKWGRTAEEIEQGQRLALRWERDQIELRRRVLQEREERERRIRERKEEETQGRIERERQGREEEEIREGKRREAEEERKKEERRRREEGESDKEGEEVTILSEEEKEKNMPNPSIKLPTFTGKQGEDYEEFLEEIHMIAGVCGWTPDVELQYIKLSIKGAAATWMKAIQDPEKNTIAKVRKILKDTFDDNRSPWQKHQDLTHLKQEKGQSVRDFALQVKEYDGPGKDDSSMISVFVSGVKDSIAEELEKATQLTFNSAVQRAEVLESIERRRQGRKVRRDRECAFD